MTDQAVHQEYDTSVPRSARIWNYWLGGTDNFPVDLQAGDAYSAVFPGIVTVARSSRAFLRRTITHLVNEEGVRQFLDVGTGLPTADNTHEVAQSIARHLGIFDEVMASDGTTLEYLNERWFDYTGQDPSLGTAARIFEVAQRLAPGARIVYVDHDPMVLAHGRALLTSTPEGAAGYIDADLSDPGRILAAAARTLDLSRPTALILSNILGHVGDHDQARAVVGRLMDGLPSGSFLVISDGSRGTDADYERAQDAYNETGAVPYFLRPVAEITAYFDGMELLEPGVVSVPLWRPEPGSPAAEPIGEHGGLARKP